MITTVIKFLTSNSIFIGLNGLIVGLFSSNLYGIELNPAILLATFLVTFSAYNLNKATDKVEDSINRPRTVSKRGIFYVIPSIIAIIFSLGIIALVGFWPLMILIVSVIMSLAYSVKLSLSTIWLKEVVGVKSLVVAFSWAFTGSFLPACLQSVAFEEIILTFFYIFIVIFVNTILCDILDMNGDMISGLKTIPILLGLNRTKKFIYAVNSLLIIWLLFCIMERIFVKNQLALCFGIFYGYGIIWMFSRKNSNRLLVELVVDGEWIPLITLMN